MASLRTRFGPFALGLAAVALLALAIRFVYVLAIYPDSAIGGDGLEFHLLARFIAEGYGYAQSPPLLAEVPRTFGDGYVLRPGGEVLPSAHKPPLYPLTLVPASLIDVGGVTLQRLTSAVLGSAAVVVVGLVGRRIGGPRAGIVAAALAAVYPVLWATDGALRSETLYLLMVALVLLAALDLLRRPALGRAALLGALIGLTALTRSEGLALIALLGVPVCLAGAAAVGRWKATLALVAACAVVVAPWIVRNSLAFERPTAISTQDGGLLFGANCPQAYSGPAIGSWPCFVGIPGGDRNEAAVSAEVRGRAIDYALANAGRLPSVIVARELRTWDLWQFPAGTANFEAGLNNRSEAAHTAGIWFYYVLVPLAVAGAVTIRWRRAELLVLLAPVALVVITTALTYGTTRFRAAAEASIVVLAAVALDRAWGAIGPAREAPEAGPAEPAAARSA